MDDAALIQVTETHAGDVPASAATLHLTVVGSRLFAGDAALREAVEVRKLVDALRAAGVGDGEIALEGVSLDVEKGLLSKSSTATYRIRVHCSEIARLPKLLEAVTAEKGSTLANVEWEYDGAAARKNEWLRECVARAQKKVASIAHALGVELDGVHRVREEVPHEIGAAPQPVFFGVARARASLADELSGLELAPARKMSVRIDVAYRIRR